MTSFKDILILAGIIAVIAFATWFASCDSCGTNYTYHWKVEVTYTNGEVEQIECSRESFKGNECSLRLKISQSGTFSSGGTSPCLVMQCGFREEVVSCGIRKFKIISEDKILIE